MNTRKVVLLTMKIICKATINSDLKKYNEDCELITKADGSVPIGHFKGLMRFNTQEGQILNRANLETQTIKTAGGTVRFNLNKLLAIYLQYGFKNLRVYEGELVMVNAEDEFLTYERVVEPQPVFIIAAELALKHRWSDLHILLKQIEIWYQCFTEFNAPNCIPKLTKVFTEIKETHDWIPDIKAW